VGWTTILLIVLPTKYRGDQWWATKTRCPPYILGRVLQRRQRGRRRQGGPELCLARARRTIETLRLWGIWGFKEVSVRQKLSFWKKLSFFAAFLRPVPETGEIPPLPGGFRLFEVTGGWRCVKLVCSQPLIKIIASVVEIVIERFS